jgi:mannitol-1-phosphate/altronate dehydrogenase
MTKNCDIESEVVTIGSGRLLRSLLLPILEQIGWRVTIAQPRGTEFVEQYYGNGGQYEYTVAHPDGREERFVVGNVIGALAMSDPSSLQDFLDLPQRCNRSLRMVAIGVTEVGLEANSRPINNLGTMGAIFLL